MQLWRELRKLGFPGTVKQVRRWLSERRTRPAKTRLHCLRTTPSTAPTALPLSLPLPSPKQLSWHLLRELDDLDAEAGAQIACALQDGEAAKVVDLGRRLCRVIRNRSGAARAEPCSTAAFDTWLTEAAPAACARSRASPPASIKMALRFVPAFDCDEAAGRPRGRSTASSCLSAPCTAAPNPTCCAVASSAP